MSLNDRTSLSNKSSLVDWLLSAKTPSIRHLTQVLLLGIEASTPEAAQTKLEVMQSEPVSTILAGQATNGAWAGERSYYTPKYTSAHWSMLLLAELGADGADPRLQAGAIHMLEATRDELEAEMKGGPHKWQCFWGNLLRYAVHCGLEDDSRVKRIVAHLAREGEAGWRCTPHNGGLPCAWGAARSLWGLAALSGDARHEGGAEAAESAIGFLLDGGHLVGGDYPASGKVNTIWSRLNFPLFYQADTLLVLRALAELGALDRPGAAEALDWLSSRRDANGRWRGTSPFGRRTWPFFSDREETARWISLQAAFVFKQAGQWSASVGQ